VIWALIFPYLPLRYSVTVNGWQLTPAHELGSAQIVDGGRDFLDGLLRLYGLDGGARGIGALAHAVGRALGSEFDPADIPPLRRAVTTAMLDQNPSPLMPEEERSGNEGQQSTTSDNGLAWGHEIGDDGYVAAEYGLMIPTLSGGYNALNPASMSFRTPMELRLPFGAKDLDEDYASALHRKITDDTDEGRRLSRTLDWLDIAWRNTESMNQDVRIFALRAGYEVLFDDDETFRVRDKLSELLDPSEEPRIPRTWTSRTGSLKIAELTDLGWWFQQFAFLRNALAHGHVIEEARYVHDGVSHVLLAALRLRQAIREVVTQDGNEELRHPPSLRAAFRRLDELNSDGLGG
jgi:hypothetical protein